MDAEKGDDGRLDRPPPAERLAALPPEIDRRFLICVDTEEEFDWFDRTRWHDYRVTATRSLPAAHRRFADAGAQLIYLVDYPVADDPASVEALGEVLQMGCAEIGAQLHPWVTPPREMPGSRAIPKQTFAGALPENEEEAKISTLAIQIERAFGERPTVYRAGRYGVGPRSADMLIRQGFALDLSIRALFDYSAEGGTDFSRFGPRPFWAGRDASLLALPLGAAFTGWSRRRGRAWYRRLSRLPLGLSVAARARFLARVPLTPEGVPFPDAAEAVRVMLGEGVPVLSFSFHSPSVEPGHTPYVRNAADLDAFNRWWDDMLDLLARERVTAITTRELIAAARHIRAA